jgi:signal transduction histidine kinase/ligand-binding sensor domain-containing protein
MLPRQAFVELSAILRLCLRAFALCLLMAALSGFVAVAEGGETYHYAAWTVDDGLPQNSVTSILQTRDGYLWLTTSDGLVRYDGVRFTVFNRSNSAGLGSNRFRLLYEDSNGSLWAGTDDGGVTVYRNGRFTTYTTKEGLPDNQVRMLSSDGAGGLLVFTRAGLARWDGVGFVPFSAGAVAPPFAEASSSRSGGFWYTDEAGLHKVDGHGNVSHIPRQAFSVSATATMFEDTRGALWIGARHGGLAQLKDGEFTTYGADEGLPQAFVNAAYEDSRGGVLFGTEGGGLVRYDGTRFVTLMNPVNQSGKRIISIYEDREGNVWTGTVNHGLNRLTRTAITVLSEREGLSDNYVYPVLEDHAGVVWVGTWLKGLFRYSGGVFSDYGKEIGVAFPLVTALHEDSARRLWVATGNNVGWIKEGKFTRLSGIGRSVVQVIAEDRSQRIWIGTKGGLFLYAGADVRHFTTKDGLADNEVTDLLEDHDGNLWVGTWGGISRMEGGRFTSIKESDGLSSNHVRTLHQDRDGTLWVGTYDGGLTRLKGGRFTRYTTTDGLFSNGVFKILEDDAGNFWMSSNRGIFRVSRSQLDDFADGKLRSITSYAYGREDGLANTECNGGKQPAGVRTRDGRLWFPTQGGVAVVDPTVVKHNRLPPPVAIEECLLDREPTAFLPELRIEPDRENVEIRYTGLSFVKPEGVAFRYRMEGVDKDWVEAGSRRIAYYSHLPPGRYTFTVIAANSDGIWNEQGTSFPVVVVPPFYRTWWFYTTAFVLVAGLVAFIYERRVVHLKRQRATQEAFSRQLIDSQEAERKRIAAELHDSIGQSLAIIKNRAALSLSHPADHERALEQLDEITDAAAHAMDEVHQIAFNLRPLQLDQLGLKMSIESLLKKASSAQGLRVSFEIDEIDGVFAKDQEINLYRIVQECLGNIIKHADATHASVRVKRAGREITLTIRDDGKGFAVDGAAAGNGRRGFGMLGIAERARMLGGLATVQSVPGQGTTVQVRVKTPPGRRDE